MIYKVKPVEHPHDIVVNVPGSKSITNRALLIAALSKGCSTLKGVLFSDDSRHFIQALIDLGFPVEVDENNKIIKIKGFGGRLPKEEASINVGSAGTAARFLTAFLGLSKGRYTINSSEQMKKRPMKELLTALEDLGAKIEYLEEEYHFPFIIGNDGNNKRDITIDVDKSSQFLSALLISSVLFSEDFTINVVGKHGMAYVDMTVAMMKQFGLNADKHEDEAGNISYLISGDGEYTSMDYAIEPDLSAACYFYAIGAVLGVKSKVMGVKSNSLQGDIRFLDVLSDMGCHRLEHEDGILMSSDGRLAGGSWDLSAFSDQALTLAALAPFCQGEVEIKGIDHIRYQECDRIAAIINNLKAMGIECHETDTGVVIAPGLPKEAEIETYDDHRVAMSFSIPGVMQAGIQILDPMCCRKTFENYFEVLEKTIY